VKEAKTKYKEQRNRKWKQLQYIRSTQSENAKEKANKNWYSQSRDSRIFWKEVQWVLGKLRVINKGRRLDPPCELQTVAVRVVFFIERQIYELR